MDVFDIPLPDDCNLFLFGDAHMCSRFHYDRGLDVIMEMANSPWGGLPHTRNFLWDHGDTAEAIFHDDPRFDFDSQDPNDTVMTQKEFVVKRYKPFGDKLLGITDGNHLDNKRFKLFGKITKSICDDLGVRYGTFSSRLTYLRRSSRMSVKPIMFRHFVAHGWGNVNSRVKPYRRAACNMEIQLRAQLENKASDCMLMSMGHTHKLITCRPDERLFLFGDNKIRADWTNSRPYYGGTERFIPEDLRWYFNSGSLLRLYNDNGQVGYAERSGYDPIPIGFGICEIREGAISDIKRIALDSSNPDGYKILTR